jgi:hypothetical protein
MDATNLADVHNDLDRKWNAKDYQGVVQLLRVLHRVKATKDDILKSKIGRRVRRLYDEVSTIEDVNSCTEVTEMTKKLMKHWKDKFGGEKPVEPVLTPISAPKIQKTGVPIRDNVIARFFEFFCTAF